jgi:hypothetical protein
MDYAKKDESKDLSANDNILIDGTDEINIMERENTFKRAQ